MAEHTVGFKYTIPLLVFARYLYFFELNFKRFEKQYVGAARVPTSPRRGKKNRGQKVSRRPNAGHPRAPKLAPPGTPQWHTRLPLPCIIHGAENDGPITPSARMFPHSTPRTLRRAPRFQKWSGRRAKKSAHQREKGSAPGCQWRGSGRLCRGSGSSRGADRSPATMARPGLPCVKIGASAAAG